MELHATHLAVGSTWLGGSFLGERSISNCGLPIS